MSNIKKSSIKKSSIKKSSIKKGSIKKGSIKKDKERPYSKSREEREKRAASGNRVESISERDIMYKWNGVHKLNAKEGFELIYGFKPDVYFETTYNTVIDKANARKWWERSSAVTQCENTVGVFMANETECYICGLPIINEPECEHILPVYKAAMYLTLYRTEYKSIIDKFDAGDKLSDDENRIYKELTMEYKWAHRCCNQKKGDTDFIEYVEPKKNDPNSGSFKLDYKNTKDILKSIAESAIEGGSDKGVCSQIFAKQLKGVILKKPSNDKKVIQENINKWITNRIDILQAKQTKTQEEGSLKTIIDYLNKYTNKTAYPMFTLINLCNVISASDMNEIHTIWRLIEGRPPPIKETPPPSQITKAIAITELTRDLNEKCKFGWGRELNEGVYNLYKNIFDIPDSIQIPKLTRTGEQVNMSEVIMFSLLDVNKNVSDIGVFYLKFYSVLTYGDLLLFSEDIGKAYASNLVAQAFKIMMVSRILTKIVEFSTLGQIDTDALNRFNVQFEKLLDDEWDILTKLGAEYTSMRNDQTSYCNFLKYFEYFLKTVDNQNKENLIYNTIKPKIDLSGCSVDSLDITTDIINRAVIAYYMDESKFLKNIPEWNPDVPESMDDDVTTMLKGMAIGSIGLVSLINNNEHLLEIDQADDEDDDDEDDEIKIAEKEFNEKIKLENRSKLIDLILNISQDSPEMQNQLLDNTYLQDISGNRIIPTWNPVEIRLLLNSYYNKFLSIIFISLEKYSFMMKLTNIYNLQKESGTEDQFINRLFTYYNVFIDIYKDTTRCRGNIDEVEFQSNWYSIINCMDINQMAQLIVYIEENNNTDTGNQMDDTESDIENEEMNVDDDKMVIDDKMNVDNELNNEVNDAADVLGQLKRTRTDEDEMDVANTLVDMKTDDNEEKQSETNNIENPAKRQKISIQGGKSKSRRFSKHIHRNKITRKRHHSSLSKI